MLLFPLLLIGDDRRVRAAEAPVLDGLPLQPTPGRLAACCLPPLPPWPAGEAGSHHPFGDLSLGVVFTPGMSSTMA